MDNYLVIGASGQVGHCVWNELVARGYNTVGTYNERLVDYFVHLSLKDGPKIKELVLSLKPKIVFFCASLTHVDYCETHPVESFDVNVEGPRLVGSAIESINGKFIFLSTDYVFDGLSGPYIETDSSSPINVFGRHKKVVESFVHDRLSNALVARTTGVYSYEYPHEGKNFAQRLINSLLQRKAVKVPTDQFGMPTYAPDLAKKLVDLALDGASGLVHLAGQDLVSRYEFACRIAEHFELDKNLIEGVPTSELGQAARRPLHAGLRSIKTTSLLGYDSGLQRMRTEYEYNR